MGSKRNKQITCLQFHYDVLSIGPGEEQNVKERNRKKEKRRRRKEGGRGKGKEKKTSSKASTEKDLNKKRAF